MDLLKKYLYIRLSLVSKGWQKKKGMVLLVSGKIMVLVMNPKTIKMTILLNMIKKIKQT